MPSAIDFRTESARLSRPRRGTDPHGKVIMTDKDKLSLVRKVALCMGPGWVPVATDHMWAVELHGPDGVEFVFDIAEPWRRKAGRIEIRLSVPDELRQAWNYSKDRLPKIGVAPAKNPAKIAADIKRRLLPDALAFLATLRERKAETDAYDRRKAAARDAVMEALGASFQGAIYNGNLSVGRYGDGPYGTIETHSDDSFRLEIHANTAATVKLATLWAEL